MWDTVPLAFVNIVLFDKNFDFLDAAWTQINASAKQVGVSPDVPHDELIQEYSIDEEGYVFMYVSNNSPLKVYFDDVTFTYTPTNVIQYNEYYPFGLQTNNSWTRDNNRNDYLYNAGSELNATSGWYETLFRGYDPTLGRFLQVDPLAAKYGSYTPYNFANNNPVLLSDPTGADALPDGIPDWVQWRMEMIQMSMTGRSTTERQMRRSQQRWSESAMSLETFLAAAVPSGSHGGYWHDGSGLLYRYDSEVDQYFNWNKYGGESITREQWLALGGDESKTALLYFPGAWEAQQEPGNIEIIIASNQFDLFRYTEVSGSSRAPIIHKSWVAIEYDNKGRIEKMTGQTRIDYTYMNYKLHIPLVILPDFDEFISLVEKYHAGDFIGDSRPLLKKYIDFILSPRETPRNSLTPNGVRR